MGVIVRMNQHRINELSETAVKALEMTVEAVHTDIGQAETVPMRTGALSGEQFFVDYEDSRRGLVSLVNSTPYARRLYYILNTISEKSFMQMRGLFGLHHTLQESKRTLQGEHLRHYTEP